MLGKATRIVSLVVAAISIILFVICLDDSISITPYWFWGLSIAASVVMVITSGAYAKTGSLVVHIIAAVVNVVVAFLFFFGGIYYSIIPNRRGIFSVIMLIYFLCCLACIILTIINIVLYYVALSRHKREAAMSMWMCSCGRYNDAKSRQCSCGKMRPDVRPEDPKIAPKKEEEKALWLDDPSGDWGGTVSSDTGRTSGLVFDERMVSGGLDKRPSPDADMIKKFVPKEEQVEVFLLNGANGVIQGSKLSSVPVPSLPE